MSTHTLPTIADGGIETALEERLGQELPEFAAFVLMETEEGRAALREYYRPFLELARAEQIPLALDTPTWRASQEWGDLLGYEATALARINEAAARLTRETADEVAPGLSVTIGGCVGPRFDEPTDDERMSADEAEAYHSPQVRALATGGVDRVTAVTMGDAAEATGVVRAARAAGVAAVASFAVDDVGRLGDGSLVLDAIRAVDEATGGYADGFFINCAHPTEVALALTGESGEANGAMVDRIIGFRLNAAKHGEELGDPPRAFAQQVLELRALAPTARIFGGCCGTDTPHIAALAQQLQDDA